MLQQHPAAALFPPMTEAEFRGLVDDIRVNGQREPVLLSHDGLVVDGRHRDRACCELGIKPTTKTIPEGTSIVSLVLSLNLHRRNLDTSQRALVAARSKSLFEEEAALRRRATQNNKSGDAVKANLPELHKGQARDHAARALNVSPRSVETASKVIAHGIPEVVALVEQGELAVSAAAAIVEQPTEAQRAVMEMTPEERAAAVRSLRKAFRDAVRGPQPVHQQRPVAKPEPLPEPVDHKTGFRVLSDRESDIYEFWDRLTEEMTQRPHPPQTVAEIVHLPEFRYVRDRMPRTLEVIRQIVQECLSHDNVTAETA